MKRKKAVAPSNHLEALKGDRLGQFLAPLNLPPYALAKYRNIRRTRIERVVRSLDVA
jgi:hypothetical protein